MSRHEVEVSGEVTALTFPAAGTNPVLRASLDLDPGQIELVFVGHTYLPGLHVGRRMRARGRIFVNGSHYQMFNPMYWLKAEDYDAAPSSGR
ncbi:MAG: hypothetical protein Q4P33_06005 [Flaviflexus sp.]|nr:hypothetical protein [Flaviflexus sp.]